MSGSAAAPAASLVNSSPPSENRTDERVCACTVTTNDSPLPTLRYANGASAPISQPSEATCSRAASKPATITWSNRSTSHPPGSTTPSQLEQVVDARKSQLVGGLGPTRVKLVGQVVAAIVELVPAQLITLKASRLTPED